MGSFTALALQQMTLRSALHYELAGKILNPIMGLIAYSLLEEHFTLREGSQNLNITGLCTA